MTLESLKPFITWLSINPHWGFFLTFLIAFSESIAIVGLFIPGAVIMSAIGILVGAGILPLVPTIIWAVLGALLGDILSFAFGHHYRDQIWQMWPFHKMTRWLERGELFFENHGGKGIFLGRFLGPIRPILPMIAGMMSLSWLRFIIVDIFSALLWAPAYMLPGFIIGTASLALGPDAASRIILILFTFLIIFWLFFWLLKKIVFYFVNIINRYLQSLWVFLESHPRYCIFCQFLRKAHIPEDHTQFALACLSLISFILFISLTIFVLQKNVHIAINTDVLHFFQSIYSPLMQRIFVLISLFGEPINLSIMWLCVAAYFAYKKQWGIMWYWLFLGFFAIGLAGVTKRVVNFPRPYGLIETPSTGSFPSGHVALASIFFGFIAYLIARYRGEIVRNLSITITLFLVGFIAFSRLYLSAHWLTDTIASLLLCGFLLSAFIISFRSHDYPDVNVKELFSITILSLLLGFIALIIHDFQKDVRNYTPRTPEYSVNSNYWWQFGLGNEPVYRANRLGTPIQTMNVEWLGDIDNIETTLLIKGWQEKPKSHWINILNYFGAANPNNVLPLFPFVYEGKQPILLMTKFVGNPPRLLVLRLWDSFAVVTDSNEKLWVGTLAFQRSAKYHFLLSLKKPPSADELAMQEVLLQNPMDSMIPDLADFKWKKLNLTQYPKLNNHEDYDWNGYVLLVKDN